MEYNGYLIENDRTYGLYFIKPKGKGSVMKELRGMFTKMSGAMQAIDLLNEKRKKKNGASNSSGGD